MNPEQLKEKIDNITPEEMEKFKNDSKCLDLLRILYKDTDLVEFLAFCATSVIALNHWDVDEYLRLIREGSDNIQEYEKTISKQH